MDDTVTAIYGSGGGDYLKGDDIPKNEDWEVVISGWEKKEMDQTDFETGEKSKKWKAILSFAGEESRKLVLNVTNANAIKAAYGDNLSEWVGKTIILYQGDWKGTPAVRVRTPKAVKKNSILAMSKTLDDADIAIDHLRETEVEHAQLLEQKILKEHMLKHVEALCIVAQDNQPGSATVKQARARASDRYREAIEETAAAAAEFCLSHEKRDRANKTISLAQTAVKDRS